MGFTNIESVRLFSTLAYEYDVHRYARDIGLIKLKPIKTAMTPTEESDDESTPILLHDKLNNTNNSHIDDLEHSTNCFDKDKLIQELEGEIVRLKKAVEHAASHCTHCHVASHADKLMSIQAMDNMYAEGPITLAIRRSPALFATLIIELLGGLVISQLNSVIKKYTLIVSFMPAISALSGNHNLPI